MAWIDISTPLRDGMPVYPGDPEMRIGRAMSLAAGDIADVTEFSMSAHTGTHVDAPAHVITGAPGVDGLDPDALVGRARVVAVPPGGGDLGKEAVRGWALGSDEVRVLVRSGVREEDAGPRPGFTPAGARALVAHGVRLVGIDTMSIAAAGDPVPTHVALLEAGVVIVEGLRLAAAPPGAYDMVCLPLLIPGADGAPARALLRPAAP